MPHIPLPERPHKHRLRLQRVAVLVGVVIAFLLLWQASNLWFKTHPIDFTSYKLRGALRYAVFTGCCGAEEKWRTAETNKLVMPKDITYQNMTPAQLQQQMPVRVISLARATERRAAVIKKMEEAGLKNYEMVDAVDGRNTSFPDGKVAKYVRGIRLRLWRKGLPYHRGKVAIDLSHFYNLQRIVRENRPAAIIEDDAGFPATKDWYGDLLAALRELPQDWDILCLNACYTTIGKALGKRVAVMKGGLCTLGYIATPRFAKLVLTTLRSANRRGLAPLVDLLFDDLVHHWEANAYICQPTLLVYTSTPSTLEYSDASASLTLWQKVWLANVGA